MQPQLELWSSFINTLWTNIYTQEPKEGGGGGHIHVCICNRNRPYGNLIRFVFP